MYRARCCTSIPNRFALNMRSKCAPSAQRRRDVSGLGVVLLWIETVFDVLLNAARVHADIFRQDLSYFGRTLRQSPGYALTVIGIAGPGSARRRRHFRLPIIFCCVRCHIPMPTGW